jgi:hypothetical protein
MIDRIGFLDWRADRWGCSDKASIAIDSTCCDSGTTWEISSMMMTITRVLMARGIGVFRVVVSVFFALVWSIYV